MLEFRQKRSLVYLFPSTLILLGWGENVALQNQLFNPTYFFTDLAQDI